MKNLLFLLIFIGIYKYYNCDIFTFPFKRIIPNIPPNINDTDFYSIYQNNDIYTSIKVGNPPSKIQLKIKFAQYSLCIRNDSLSYDYNKSSTYEPNGKEITHYIDYSRAIPSKESFILGKENKKLDDIHFMLTTNTKYDSDGIFGLRIKENDEKTYGNGLMEQLKSKNVVNKDVFFFNWEKNRNDGDLIIGKFPHEIKQFEDEFPEYQFKRTKIFRQSYDVDYDLDFHSIFFNEKQMKPPQKVYIRLELGYIYAPNEFEDLAYDLFFQKHYISKKCKRNVVNVLYNAYICEDSSDIDITKFPNIKFYLSDDDYNMTLTYEDVFIKKNGKIYFMIIFDKNGRNAFWHLGDVFIKRNKLVFDVGGKIIGYYDKSVKEDKTPSIVVYIIIISIAGLVILGLLGFIIYKLLEKKRNKKPYELDDNYDYDSPINA